MDLIYKTRVFSQGGRNGRVQSEDGLLKLDLAQPAEMGGTKPGANPEQLFAAAYAACFENSVRHIIRSERMPVKGCMVEAEVSCRCWGKLTAKPMKVGGCAALS